MAVSAPAAFITVVTQSFGFHFAHLVPFFSQWWVRVKFTKQSTFLETMPWWLLAGLSDAWTFALFTQQSSVLCSSDECWQNMILVYLILILHYGRWKHGRSSQSIWNSQQIDGSNKRFLHSDIEAKCVDVNVAHTDFRSETLKRIQICQLKKSFLYGTMSTL